MKKILVLLTLGGLLIAGGSIAFAADTPQNAQGNGYMMQNQFASPEDALNAKIERINDMQKEGKITPEQAAEFKTRITERMNSCDGSSDRESKERLGIGFGRMGGNGEAKGNGEFNGTGNRNGARSR